MNKKKYNIPKTYVESCMVRLCTEFGTENKSNDFIEGWHWFLNKAFPDVPPNSNSPSSVKIPDDANKEFIEGATKCHKVVETFYSNTTMLIVTN